MLIPVVPIHCIVCYRIACAQHHFRIIFYITTVDSCSYKNSLLHKYVYCCCYGNDTSHSDVHVTQISSLHSRPSQIVSTLLSLLSAMLNSE